MVHLLSTTVNRHDFGGTLVLFGQRWHQRDNQSEKHKEKEREREKEKRGEGKNETEKERIRPIRIEEEIERGREREERERERNRRKREKNEKKRRKIGRKRMGKKRDREMEGKEEWMKKTRRIGGKYPEIINKNWELADMTFSVYLSTPIISLASEKKKLLIRTKTQTLKIIRYNFFCSKFDCYTLQVWLPITFSLFRTRENPSSYITWRELRRSPVNLLHL